MIHVYVLVEGQTEESFINEVIASRFDAWLNVLEQRLS